MPVSRKRRKSSSEHDGRWYENERHANQVRNEKLFDAYRLGWSYCDPDTFYHAMFPDGTLQKKGNDSDGKPNVIVLEDTGKEIDRGVDSKGNKLVKRIMHRYTLHDGLEELEELRKLSIEQNTFMFLAPVSYYGKTRSSRNARYLHAIMIDLDYVGERELDNLLHQMERGAIPYANYLVSSGTGLHVVYLLEHPVPLMTRYVTGLQVLKRELTDRVWNANTSASDPDKKQTQGIFQGFRMVGSATKLNGDIGNPKIKQPYVAECFSHDATPPATIPYLLSFVPKLRDKKDMDDLAALRELTQEARKKTPIAQAKELWPEWYERCVVNGEPRGGWTYGRAGYDRVLSVIRDQASVDHRYWCIFYLAVMANKCGVSYDELEDDAYGLLDRFDALSVEPSNRFTANDVAAALEAFEGGSAAGRARRYTQGFCERKAAVSYGEKMGHGSNPPDKRLPRDLSLEKARMTRDLNQRASGTNWWDNGNRDGAPTKAMQVWRAAVENPGLSVAAIARKAEVSRPTVYKWLKPGWEAEYAAATRKDEASRPTPRPARHKVIEEQAEQFKRRYAEDSGAFEATIVRHIASHPWEPFSQTAAFFGLSDAAAVEKIASRNKTELDRAKLGLEESFRAWNSETDDYFDAMTAARVLGRFDEFMAARATGVQSSIEWARREIPSACARLQEIRSEGRQPTAEDLVVLKEMYIDSI